MAPEQRNGGGLLMDCLIALGGPRVWRPGRSYLAVLDAMYDRDNQFALTLCRMKGRPYG